MSKEDTFKDVSMATNAVYQHFADDSTAQPNIIFGAGEPGLEPEHLLGMAYGI